MKNNWLSYFKSSIGRKQIVAVTGLMLVGFLAGHLAGNLFFYGGPEAFNAYAKKLHSLRPALYIVEFKLLLVFLIHIYFTATLVIENRQARAKGYAVSNAKGKRSFATKIMPYTGTILLAFVVWHLLDFTFTDHLGARSYLADGESYGLYGVVYNSFRELWHSAFYIIAMACVGFHLYHGVKSVIQTCGWGNSKTASMIEKISLVLSVGLAAGFASIPIYVLLQ